jgi:hypothetical protein
MRSVTVALAASIAVTVLAAGAVLSQSPLVVLATNSVASREALVTDWQNASACQSGERLPAGTLAIRLTVGAIFGPRMTVRVLEGSRVLTSGEQQSGWTGRDVGPCATCRRHDRPGGDLLCDGRER